MKPRQQQQLEARAKIIKAVAHPSRLLMVEALAKKKRCVCELTALVGADMSTVSKHLSQLKDAGIVRDERQGTKIFYELRCPCVIGFLDCVERVLAECQAAAT